MLAITAALVGCSQDELVTVDTQQVASVDLSGRPVLEDVTLGTGLNSRMAIKEGSAIQAVYEESDQIGASLIDIPNYEGTYVYGTGDYATLNWGWEGYKADSLKALTSGGVKYSFAQAGADARGFYTIQEHISSNYPFTRSEDGNFYTNAELVEGNYMFYLPYDESHRIRERLNVVVPQIQDCSDEVMRETTKGQAKINTSSTALDKFFGGETEDFENAIAVVGYQFLSKDNTKPQVKMEPVFAYPLITIENNFNSFIYADETETEATAPATATMVIDSIQIYYAGQDENPLFYKAAISSDSIAKYMASNLQWSNARFGAEAPTADILDDVAVTTEYDQHVNVFTALPKINDALTTDVDYVASNHVTLVLGKELANGESYSFHAVLPAGDYGQDLTARVYATIDGKACVITDAVNTPVENADEEVEGHSVELTSNVDYAFVDEKHGSQPCVLLRGEQYPKAEFIINNKKEVTGLKGFVGDMLTISLESEIDEDGVVTGATAFELYEITTPPASEDLGITDNTDFINYLDTWVQLGETLTENTANQDEARSEWGTNIAFAEDHEVIINATLVQDLYEHLWNDKIMGENTILLTLTSTSLPIASDVKFSENSGTYTFSTLDNKYSVKIKYAPSVVVGNKSNALVAGINKISTQTGNSNNLAVKTGESNAVVVLNNYSATYAGATGISAIYVPSGSTLKVNAACNVLVIADGGTIEVGENGSLTNSNNIFNGASITNNFAKQVAGTLSNTIVTANLYVWPSTTLAANSRINKIIVAPEVEKTITIEQAQISKLANLSQVTIELGENITGIVSAANVTLTNVKEIAAENLIPWNAAETADAGITVSAVKYNGTNYTTIDKIYEGQGVTPGTGTTFAAAPSNP